MGMSFNMGEGGDQMDRERTSEGGKGIADSGSVNASAERDETRKHAQRLKRKHTEIRSGTGDAH
jgi:hypothetical protein